MKWFVTGADGMLGTDLVDLLRSAGEDVTDSTLETLDITDERAVLKAVQGHDIVVNTAAWTAVDEAETHEDEARLVNGVAPAHLARAAAREGARLVQISTDYVFDGSADTPYAEDAPTSPTSAYGRTKEAGERAVQDALPDAHLLVRTAWLYGAHGRCFPKTIARLARERDQVDVVDDQVGQPTWTRDVADLVVRLVAADAPAGTYHATSTGSCSWFDFAQAVVVAAGRESSVVQRTSSASIPVAGHPPGVLGAGARGAGPGGTGPDRRLGAALGRGRTRGARGLLTTERQLDTAGPMSSHQRAADRCQDGATRERDSGTRAGEAVMPSMYSLARSRADHCASSVSLTCRSQVRLKPRWPSPCVTEMPTRSVRSATRGTSRRTMAVVAHVSGEVGQPATQPLGVAVGEPEQQGVRYGRREGRRRDEHGRGVATIGVAMEQRLADQPDEHAVLVVGRLLRRSRPGGLGEDARERERLGRGDVLAVLDDVAQLGPARLHRVLDQRGPHALREIGDQLGEMFTGQGRIAAPGAQHEHLQLSGLLGRELAADHLLPRQPDAGPVDHGALGSGHHVQHQPCGPPGRQVVEHHEGVAHHLHVGMGDVRRDGLDHEVLRTRDRRHRHRGAADLAVGHVDRPRQEAHDPVHQGLPGALGQVDERGRRQVPAELLPVTPPVRCRPRPRRPARRGGRRTPESTGPGADRSHARAAGSVRPSGSRRAR